MNNTGGSVANNPTRDSEIWKILPCSNVGPIAITDGQRRRLHKLCNRGVWFTGLRYTYIDRIIANDSRRNGPLDRNALQAFCQYMRSQHRNWQDMMRDTSAKLERYYLHSNWDPYAYDNFEEELANNPGLEDAYEFLPEPFVPRVYQTQLGTIRNMVNRGRYSEYQLSEASTLFERRNSRPRNTATPPANPWPRQRPQNGQSPAGGGIAANSQGQAGRLNVSQSELREPQESAPDCCALCLDRSTELVFPVFTCSHQDIACRPCWWNYLTQDALSASEEITCIMCRGGLTEAGFAVRVFVRLFREREWPVHDSLLSAVLSPGTAHDEFRERIARATRSAESRDSTQFDELIQLISPIPENRLGNPEAMDVDDEPSTREDFSTAEPRPSSATADLYQIGSESMTAEPNSDETENMESRPRRSRRSPRLERRNPIA